MKPITFGIMLCLAAVVVVGCARNWRVPLGTDVPGHARFDVAHAHPVAAVGQLRPQVPAEYPSALLPPVGNPYLFVWTFGAPDYVGMAANVVGSGRGDQHQHPGVLTARWCYGPQNPKLRSKQEFVDYYVNLAGTDAAAIAVDEWQSTRDDGEHPQLAARNPFGIEGAIEGIARAKKLNPALYVIIYWRGEESLWPLLERGLPDLIVVEGYTHRANGRGIPLADTLEKIDYLRRHGAIERSIVMLGHIERASDYRAGPPLTAPIIEREIRRIREYAPEMPGIGFFHANDSRLAEAADRLTQKYFIEPAPVVNVLSPAKEAAVEGRSMEMRVEATAKNGRAIREYRWFLDNVMVGTSKQGVHRFDLSHLPAGEHYLTVHAIDTGWNRAAAQVKIVTGM